MEETNAHLRLMSVGFTHGYLIRPLRGRFAGLNRSAGFTRGYFIGGGRNMKMAKGERRTMTCVAVLISCSLVAGTWFVARAGGPKRLSPEPRLIAHEWGTMTEVMGEEGEAITWQPLLPPSDLPGFVYGMGGSIGGGFKRFCAGTVRMETPVVYLYSDVETDASVKV